MHAARSKRGFPAWMMEGTVQERAVQPLLTNTHALAPLPASEDGKEPDTLLHIRNHEKLKQEVAT